MRIKLYPMNNRNEASSSQRADHALQIVIGTTIILMGFMVMVKICKEMIQDIQEINLR
jgi:hypothetical protein